MCIWRHEANNLIFSHIWDRPLKSQRSLRSWLDQPDRPATLLPRPDKNLVDLSWAEDWTQDLAAIKACPVGVKTEEQQKNALRKACSELEVWFPSWMYMIGPFFLGESYTVGWFVSWSCWQDIRECVCPCLIFVSVNSHPQLLNFLSSYDFKQYVTNMWGSVQS